MSEWWWGKGWARTRRSRLHKKSCPYLTSVEPTCFIPSPGCGYCAAGNIKIDGGTSSSLLMVTSNYTWHASSHFCCRWLQIAKKMLAKSKKEGSSGFETSGKSGNGRRPLPHPASGQSLATVSQNSILFSKSSMCRQVKSLIHECMNN